jgi:phosphatidylserine/phosphatidylglycerophosphate/cardiolipin synthase-like enzyme/uncharacterized membrane protein YdjX (TVP38/TMEM64 family)
MSPAPDTSPRDLLREGETIWRRAEAKRVALLLDGASYFGALRSTLLAARHSVTFVGWDIDSRVRLRGPASPANDKAPEEFRDFLEYLADRRKDLVIRLLLWDYSILYALEREPLPAVQLDWRTPSNVVVKLDDALPMGAAHHQKIVIVDDALAFCGGMDIAINRWDTEDHAPGNPERRDPSGKPYGPYHDVQMVLDGPAANCLADLVRMRWKRATGEDIEPVEKASSTWPDEVEPDFDSVDAGIARTLPKDDDQEAVREIRDLYLESIRQAERYIYIENQYLTVDEIADALASRMRDRAELEALILTPDRPHGWLETKTMGVGQAQFMAQFDDPAFRDRIRFFNAYTGEGENRVPVFIHAKLMVVDDRLLRVGSANLNHRSMGLDSECDIAIEAKDENEQRQIRGILSRLLAHHTGSRTEKVDELLDSGMSLIETVESLSQPERGIRRMTPAAEYSDAISDTLNLVADSEQPLEPGEIIGDMFGGAPRQSALRRAIRLVTVALVLAALVFVWNYTPLADWTDPDKIARALEAFRANSMAIPILLGAYLVGGLLLFPLTALITVTGMVLGPWAGFFCGITGSLISAAAGFGIGHVAGKSTLTHLLGKRFRRIKRVVTSRSVLAVMVIRMVPVAPYTVVNAALGAVGVGFWPYIAGTLLGLLPGVLALTVLGDRLLQAWRNPEPLNIIWFVLAILVWLSLAIGLQRLVARIKKD